MRGTQAAPELQAGICSGEEISFTLNRPFREKRSGTAFRGRCSARISEGKIILSGEGKGNVTDVTILLLPEDAAGASFTLHAVTIGVDFHWQRKEDQVFRGSLKLIREGELITAVNLISIEEYLRSVISSEMSASASEEFLKAHAVISRSWLLAQIEKRGRSASAGEHISSCTRSEDEIIKWYDREDHLNFDVCADDHCQRYQGITRASTPSVSDVIEKTSGEVLTYDGTICDTRFYKCCGGVTELFENVWEPVSHPYLQRVIDNPAPPAGFSTNLEDEEAACRWIYGSPEAFCNTSDREILSQVLNDYDQETNDFFRWKVTYSQAELSELVKSRTGIDFGSIINLVPLERGASGRIIRLKIEGSLKTMIIGKELEIRKALSRSHLYSSCFVAERSGDGEDVLFTLHGAGWGHGAGLCQIGAAVMGARGYTYRQILEHYFPGSKLEKRY